MDPRLQQEPRSEARLPARPARPLGHLPHRPERHRPDAFHRRRPLDGALPRGCGAAHRQAAPRRVGGRLSGPLARPLRPGGRPHATRHQDRTADHRGDCRERGRRRIAPHPTAVQAVRPARHDLRRAPVPHVRRPRCARHRQRPSRLGAHRPGRRRADRPVGRAHLGVAAHHGQPHQDRPVPAPGARRPTPRTYGAKSGRSTRRSRSTRTGGLAPSRAARTSGSNSR